MLHYLLLMSYLIVILFILTHLYSQGLLQVINSIRFNLNPFLAGSTAGLGGKGLHNWVS